MKTAHSAPVALAAILALGSFSFACSSPDKGQEVDTGTALSQLRSPTGSFSKANGASVFAGYRSQRAESSKVSAPTGGGSGSSSTSSIRLLDKATTSEKCAQGTACACPNGGTMSYRAQSSAEGQLVRVSFDACGFEDGFGFDGEAVLLASTKSLLNLPAETETKKGSSTTPTPTDGTQAGSSGGLKEAPSGGSPSTGSSSGKDIVAILLAAKGTATEGTRKLPLEFALLTEAHYVFLAVTVPDGSIVIGVSDQGNAIIRSKEGTWNCKNASRGWTCTSDKGEALEVAESAADGLSNGSSDGSQAPSSPSDS